MEARVESSGESIGSPVARLGSYFVSSKADCILKARLAWRRLTRSLQEVEVRRTLFALSFRKELLSWLTESQVNVNEKLDFRDPSLLEQ